VNATKCLKYEETSILNEVVQARNKKEVIDKHLICHMQQHDIAISTSQADEWVSHYNKSDNHTQS